MWFNKTFSFFWGSVLFVMISYAYAVAFEAEVIPSEVRPGDAFIIKISGIKTKEYPAVVLKEKQIYFSSCGEGCFIAIWAVDMKTTPGIYPIKISVGINKTNLKLIVKKTSFPEIAMTLPESQVFLNPEDMKRAQREAKRLKSIWPVTTERQWEGNFILPLKNKTGTVFGTKRVINKKKISIHRGMDIKGKEGENIKASNKGKIVLAEELFFGGNTVIIDHGLGIFTIYMHLSSFNVKPEDVVSKGYIIGFVGSSGRSSGPHLHFGLKVLGINTNPVSLTGLELE